MYLSAATTELGDSTETSGTATCPCPPARARWNRSSLDARAFCRAGREAQHLRLLFNWPGLSWLREGVALPRPQILTGVPPTIVTESGQVPEQQGVVRLGKWNGSILEEMGELAASESEGPDRYTS